MMLPDQRWSDNEYRELVAMDIALKGYSFRRPQGIDELIDDAPKADRLPSLDELQHIQGLCEGVLNEGE